MNDLKRRIAAVFARAETRDDALSGIYRVLLPGWDEAAVIRQWPSCGPALYDFLCERFEEFDREHGAEPDGVWQTVGFIKNAELDGWSVSYAACGLSVKKAQAGPAERCSS